MVQAGSKAEAGMSPSEKQAKLMLAGGVAGAFAKTCTAPLSRLTILYQVQSFEGAPPTVVQALTRVVKTQGFLSLWRGHMATLLHRVPYSAVNFAVFENSVKVLSPYLRSIGDGGTVGTETTRYLIAGGLGGSVGCAFAYPLDLVKTRLAGHMEKQAHYRGVLDCMSKIVRQEGVFALYRGLTATLFQVTPMLAINFASYETVKRILLRRYVEPLMTPPTLAAQGKANHLEVSGVVPALHGNSADRAQPGATTPSSHRQHAAQTSRLPAALEPSDACEVDPSTSACRSPVRPPADPPSAMPREAEEACCSSNPSRSPTLGRDTPSGMAYSAAESMASAALDSIAARKAAISLVAGSLSGVVSSTLTFPLDVVRRNLQMKHAEKLTWMECVKSIHRKKGWPGFYAGIVAEYLKVIPSVSIAFCSYEFLKTFLGLNQ